MHCPSKLMLQRWTYHIISYNIFPFQATSQPVQLSMWASLTPLSLTSTSARTRVFRARVGQVTTMSFGTTTTLKRTTCSRWPTSSATPMSAARALWAFRHQRTMRSLLPSGPDITWLKRNTTRGRDHSFPRRQPQPGWRTAPQPPCCVLSPSTSLQKALCTSRDKMSRLPYKLEILG